ncbi:MAG: glycosyltransferase family A protein [Cyanobacteria bacterium J06555_13]
MSKVIYLIQGQAKHLKKFFPLTQRADIDVLFLTYDEKIDEAIYFPNSTWGEGRNHLLEQALASQKEYQYYIFLDDDVIFKKGDFTEFEAQLARHNPAVAVPVFSPKTEFTILGLGLSSCSRWFMPIKDYQICKYADAQFIAFHRDVVENRLVVPLQTRFDTLSWGGTSSTQQLLIFNLYNDTTLQFNTVIVTNEAHRDYPRGKGKFKQAQQMWLCAQLRHAPDDPRNYAINLLSVKGLIRAARRSKKMPSLRYLSEFGKILLGTLSYKRKERHLMSEEDMLTLLQPDSDLLKHVP